MFVKRFVAPILTAATLLALAGAIAMAPNAPKAGTVAEGVRCIPGYHFVVVNGQGKCVKN